MGADKRTRLITALRFIFLILVLAIGPVSQTACRKTHSAAEPLAGKPSQLNGQQAPQFTLVSASGGDISLSDFAGKTKLVLVFYRGYW